MPRPGDVIGGRYRIENVLGEGGFAAVFKATDSRTGKAFAVKVLDPLMSRRDEFRQRFFLEVSNSSKLNHVNTIQVSDQGETDTGCLYLVMELLDGKSLDDLLHERGPMPAHLVHSVAIQALRSLREAHELGILHRDIKPANIMLVNHTDNIDDFFVKVLDFGIAKSMDGSEDAALTSTGQVMCSPHYVAPERIVDHDTYPSSDLYSLGVSMVEMLEGTPPYQGENSIQLVMLHARMDSPVPMKESTRNSPLGPVLEKVTAKDYSARYQSAQEMIDALREIDFSQPHAIVAPPPKEDDSGGILQYWPIAVLFLIVLGVGLLLWPLLKPTGADTTQTQSEAVQTSSSTAAVSDEASAVSDEIDPDDDAAALGLAEDDSDIEGAHSYKLTSSPAGARVYINDKYVETTPWNFEEHNLQSPPFTLKLSLDDGREVTRSIDVLDELKTLHIAFPSASDGTTGSTPSGRDKATTPRSSSSSKPAQPSSRPSAPTQTVPDTPATTQPKAPSPGTSAPEEPAPTQPAQPSSGSSAPTQTAPDTPATTQPQAPSSGTSAPEKPAPSKPAPEKPSSSKPAPEPSAPANEPKEDSKPPAPSEDLLEKIRKSGGGYGSSRPSGGYVK